MTDRLLTGSAGLKAQEARSALDFQGLRQLQASAQRNDPQALRKAAQQFEALFTQQMLKGMRQTMPGDSLTGSEEGQLYRDMLDQQLAQNLAQGRGFGLADMLVRHLSRQSSGAAAQPLAEARPGELRRAPAAVAGSSTIAPAAGRHGEARSEGFIRAILPAAKEASRALGVNPVAVLAHAALETGWGKNMPLDGNGRPSFNLFGIKAAGWDGERVQAHTTEFVNGLARAEQAAFRAYRSVTESVQDYARFLLSNKRYQGVMGHGDDIAGFARALQRAGYATDPDYADKLAATAAGRKMRDTLASLGLSI